MDVDVKAGVGADVERDATTDDDQEKKNPKLNI